MRRKAWAGLLLIPFSLFLAGFLSGCGRLSLPSDRYRHEVITSTDMMQSSAAPKVPYWEAGSQNAKVRVLAFFAIDPEHKALQDLLKSLVKKYPGRVYVKYVDIRTAEGQQTMQMANSTGPGVLVDGQNSLTLKLPGQLPYSANFGGEMGRYWTADDLTAAVAQEVAKAYGK